MNAVELKEKLGRVAISGIEHNAIYNSPVEVAALLGCQAVLKRFDVQNAAKGHVGVGVVRRERPSDRFKEILLLLRFGL